MDPLARLVRDLAAEGTLVTDGDAPGGLVVQSFHGRPIDPPLRLALTAAQLEAHVDARAADSAAM